MKYLRDWEQYENDYDRMVIESCRDTEKRIAPLPEIVKKAKEKSLTQKEIDKEKARQMAGQLYLFFVQLDYAEKRDDTVRKWRERDRNRDELLEKTQPTKQYCHQCNILMNFVDKDLHLYFDGKKDVVLLFYECPRCTCRRFAYADGREYKTKESYCEKCHSSKIKGSMSHLKNGNTLHSETCGECGHVKEDIWEKPKERPIDPKYEEDRKRFCMPSHEAVKWKSDMKALKELMEDVDKRNKEKNPPKEGESGKKGGITL